MTIIEAKKFHAMKVSPYKMFLRTFVLWQIIRFIIINIKMTLMILKSHGSENPEFKNAPTISEQK